MSGRCAEVPYRRSILHVAVRQIEEASRFRAGEPAPCIAAFGGPRLESAQKCAADPTKTGVRRHVIQSDGPCVSYGADGANNPVLDGYEDRIIGLLDPRSEVLGRLVPQPASQNGWIIPMVRFAKLRN
jgi:hypothetical protein